MGDCKCDPCKCCTCDPCKCSTTPKKVGGCGSKKEEVKKSSGCGCGSKKEEVKKSSGCGPKNEEVKKSSGCGCGPKQEELVIIPKPKAKTTCCTCCTNCGCTTCRNPCTCKYPGINRCCHGHNCAC